MTLYSDLPFHFLFFKFIRSGGNDAENEKREEEIIRGISNKWIMECGKEGWNKEIGKGNKRKETNIEGEKVIIDKHRAINKRSKQRK